LDTTSSPQTKERRKKNTIIGKTTIPWTSPRMPSVSKSYNPLEQEDLVRRMSWSLHRVVWSNPFHDIVYWYRFQTHKDNVCPLHSAGIVDSRYRIW
jgi:hypothetical protein